MKDFDLSTIQTNFYYPMNIEYYASFFHDGALDEIEHEGDRITFNLSSAHLGEEENIEQLLLSKEGYIQGKLHLEGVKTVAIDEEPFLRKLKKPYDQAEILDLEVKGNSIEFFIQWIDFSLQEAQDYMKIEIQAEKIWWENIPDLVPYLPKRYLDAEDNPVAKGDKRSRFYPSR